MTTHTDLSPILHESEELSDCKIICGPYHFNLHKVILASQSDYFGTAFKKGTFEEGKLGTIELKSKEADAEEESEIDDACDEPEIFKLMIEYFYHFDYLHDSSQVQSKQAEESTLSKTSKTERKRVPLPPRVPCKGAVDQAPVKGALIIEHAKMFAMAVKYQVEGLQNLAFKKFKSSVETHWTHKDFAQSIFIVYNSTPEHVTQIRNVVADTLHEHF